MNCTRCASLRQRWCDVGGWRLPIAAGHRRDGMTTSLTPKRSGPAERGRGSLLGVGVRQTRTRGSDASPWPDGQPACGARSCGERSWRGARGRPRASRRGREPSCCGSTWCDAPCGAPDASSCCDACCAWQRCGALPPGDAWQPYDASPTWCAWRRRDDAPASRAGSSCGPSSSHERYVAPARVSSRYATAMCVTSSTSSTYQPG